MWLLRPLIIPFLTVYWILFSNLVTSLRSDFPLGDLPCSVTEECPIGTVVCDLELIWDKLGLPFSLPTGAQERGSDGPKPSVQITVINEAKSFVVVGTQIVSRDRIDREQYVLTKHCRSARSSASDMNGDLNDLGKYEKSGLDERDLLESFLSID